MAVALLHHLDDGTVVVVGGRAPRRSPRAPSGRTPRRGRGSPPRRAPGGARRAGPGPSRARRRSPRPGRPGRRRPAPGCPSPGAGRGPRRGWPRGRSPSRSRAVRLRKLSNSALSRWSASRYSSRSRSRRATSSPWASGAPGSGPSAPLPAAGGAADPAGLGRVLLRMTGLVGHAVSGDGPGGDGDLARLDLVGLRDAHGEHAVLEGRGDLVRLHALRQGQAALEVAVRPLKAVVAALVDRVVEPPLAPAG